MFGFLSYVVGSCLMIGFLSCVMGISIIRAGSRRIKLEADAEARVVYSNTYHFRPVGSAVAVSAAPSRVPSDRVSIEFDQDHRSA